MSGRLTGKILLAIAGVLIEVGLMAIRKRSQQELPKVSLRFR